MAVVAGATAIGCWLALRIHDKLFTPIAFIAALIGAITLLRLWWQATNFGPRWILAGIVVGITLPGVIGYTVWMRKAAKNSGD